MEHIQCALTHSDNDRLTKWVFDKEVKATVFSMGAYKALGPDGFPPVFFQEYWDIVGLDISCAARDFFKIGWLLKHHNKTYIVLVPKNDNPTSMLDFRTISLCNTFYKILTKILVNKIKPLPKKLISPTQKGFVLGRQILDASISTHEIIHSMDKRKAPCMAFKLDL